MNIPAFTPGTFNPVTATFTVTNPTLPVVFHPEGGKHVSLYLYSRAVCCSSNTDTDTNANTNADSDSNSADLHTDHDGY